MGLLINGEWTDRWVETQKTEGQFVRKDAQFRSWITDDGSAGPTGDAGFKAEAGRYHLYVSLACPWAHRTLIARRLKHLKSLISVSIVHPHMLGEGWHFSPVPEPINGLSHAHQLYTLAKANYTGRVTVPILWDTQGRTIVNNESSEILRMFNTAFHACGGHGTDLYPAPLREAIDQTNAFVYDAINNGVYKCGFATTQSAYEQAYHALFDALDLLDARLSTQRYLVGPTLTEADWRLFTTLIRFDAVYVGHFKCNKRRIADYPHLSGYLRELYQVDGIQETVDFTHIKSHYYYSHESINPTRIVPLGPALNLDAPHKRAHL